VVISFEFPRNITSCATNASCGDDPRVRIIQTDDWYELRVKAQVEHGSRFREIRSRHLFCSTHVRNVSFDFGARHN